ncbi:hypothetical protein DYH09_09225 [bacterium CPR1]|nr:hypothetical protein [bacterium CPR1]
MRRAEIVAVGSELLTPFRTDTNSLWLTEQLNELGLEVQAKSVAGDQLDLLAGVLQSALERCELVMTTGGLGPTLDDLTRDAVATVAGVELELWPDVLENLRARFAARGYEMPTNNERQAWLPRGASILPNPSGTAPGFILELGGKRLVVLPGPPRELKPMFSEHVRPLLGSSGEVLVRRVLKVNGLGESALDERIAPFYRHLDNPSTTILFTEYDIEIHLTARASSREQAETLLAGLAEPMAEKLGKRVYSSLGESLPQVLARQLKARGVRLASFESTGGARIADRMMALEEGPLVYAGGLVAPCPASLEQAATMADEARSRFGSELAVSTSVNGQEVFLGLAGPNGVETRTVSLLGNRELVAARASQSALDWLRLVYLA